MREQSPTIVTHIQPSKGWSSLGIRDLWEYRELLYFLIRREISGTYRQTALGTTWFIIRPIVNVLVLSLVFGRMLSVPSDGLPYPLFALAAILPWSYFSTSVMRGANSLVSNMHVISKVYFPRMLIPMSGVVSGLIDFAAAVLVFFVALLIYQMPLRVEMLLVPIFLLVAMLFALAVSLWLSTISVKYRDVAFALGFILQALMYLSPVIYPLSVVPEPLQIVYQLNPMTGVIQGFRWALLGSGEPPDQLFAISTLFVFVLLFSGAFIFRRTERTIVDIL